MRIKVIYLNNESRAHFILCYDIIYRKNLILLIVVKAKSKSYHLL